MAEADPHNMTGKDLRVRRRKDANQAAPYDLIAAARTKSFTTTNELGETTTHDPNDPNAVPWRTSLLVSRAWSLNLSGVSDQKRFALLRADAMTATTPAEYQLEFAGAAADGAGSIMGRVWVENLQVQSSNMQTVEFSVQLRGEGAPAWVAAAA